MRAAFVDAFDGQLLPLRGTSGEALVAEIQAAGAQWDLAGLGPRLAGRPVLLVGAGLDTDAPVDVHHHPLVAAYATDRLEHHVFPTDHLLADHRVALARTVVDFLRRNFAAPELNTIQQSDEQS